MLFRVPCGFPFVPVCSGYVRKAGALIYQRFQDFAIPERNPHRQISPYSSTVTFQGRRKSFQLCSRLVHLGPRLSTGPLRIDSPAVCLDH
jgi:hypothetical protein